MFMEECYICRKILTDDTPCVNYPHTDVYRCDPSCNNNQPERLNPEDEREGRELEFFRNNLGNFTEELKNFIDEHPLTYVCDSLNTTNK
jgi:hypothetical protein